jgi:patatin-related protein
MSNQRSYYQPKFLREMQLGLVVYGGVPLAIYTHGICQEFYHAVRGRGIYKLVKALTDADLVVDAISGSSAGGVNGILLAYAIANSNDREVVDFSEFAKIWRNSGDLLKLLQQPNLFKSPVSGTNFKLESFDLRTLRTTMEKVVDRKLPRSTQEWFSTTKEVDLAIAGTDYLGKVDRTLAENRLNLTAKNHRAVFRLKHRQNRKEPFNPYFQELNLQRTPEDTYQALIKLCQITAGIPAIFPLVEVDLQDRHNLVDRQLVTWGKLTQAYTPDAPIDRSGKLYFLDGGLLDNAPLTCLMTAAYYRLPHRSSQRKLFYVDPNPEHLNNNIHIKGKKKARIEQMLQLAALSIPMQQSITNDLRTIQEHNHKLRRYQTLIDRAEAVVDSQKLLEDTDRTQSKIYLRGRLFDFLDRNLPLVLQSDLGSQNIHYSAILEKIDRILSTDFDRSDDRDRYYKLFDKFESQILDLDVEYSIRKHFYIVDKITDLLRSETDETVRAQLEHLARQLGCSIKLLEVVRSSLDLLLRDRAVNNFFYYKINEKRNEGNDRQLREIVYQFIFRFHRFLLDGTRLPTFIPNDTSGNRLETIPVYFWIDLPILAAENDFSGERLLLGQTLGECQQERWLSQTRISSIFAQFKQRIAQLQQSTDLHPLIFLDPQLQYDKKSNQSFPSILKQIDLAGTVIIERSNHKYTDRLLKQWNTFESLDRELYPFEYLTDLNEKEIVKPICISPEKAQLGEGNGKNTEDKLSGDKLYNIGGTFKKSWKLNDLLWGRLDGLNRILEGIITPKSVTNFAGFVQREAKKTNCTQERYLDWLLTESLPHVSGKERQKISEHLAYLAQPGLQIDGTQLKGILADLVVAGQNEILQSDVHSAIEGMDDRPGWWRLPEEHPGSIDRSSLVDRELPISNPSMIARIVHQSLNNLSKQQQHFFRNQYRIGVDKLWENMPLVTLINLGTRIVLMLRNLLVKVFSISTPTPPIRHSLYHLLDGALQSIYWWLQGGSIKLGAVHRRPRIILFQVLGATTALCGIVLAFLLSPIWILFALPGAVICWFLQTMRLKRLIGGKRLSSNE